MAAGYSSTPLSKKLGIKEGSRLALLGEPKPPIADLHATLPPGVNLSRTLRGENDVLVCFITASSALPQHWDAWVKSLHVDGGLWVCWPKKQSGVATDVTEDVIRNWALEHGLVDNKVCAVDAVWSGLRLVRRLVDRPKKTRR